MVDRESFNFYAFACGAILARAHACTQRPSHDRKSDDRLPCVGLSALILFAGFLF